MKKVLGFILAASMVFGLGFGLVKEQVKVEKTADGIMTTADVKDPGGGGRP